MNWSKLFYILLYCSVSISAVAQNDNARLEWWREARFGMFIHLGLYSAAAGEWNGKEIDGIGEWIQNFAKVPNSEYEKLTKDFTLNKCKPENWVQIAKQAGAKYIVFTAKHHDGFCLYPSDVTDFDIESTPYKGDPLKELIDACHKYGIKVGIYYSHRQDWREEDAAVMKNEYDGHYGKLKSEIKPDLERYIREKALPQVRELLTRYGKIDLLWYDTPFDLSKEQSQKFVNVVRELQPDCLINGRVGYNLGDYGALGDNEMPCARAVTDLEMVATLNHTWGYKKNDNAWKGKKEILCSLIESVSRNVNYMVNIGPRADGVVPQPSVDIMNFVGNWLHLNSEAIYGATGNPFNDNFPWGYVTRKGNNLYLHLIRQPQGGRIVLNGLVSDILSATLLESGKKLSTSHYTISVPKGLDYEKVPVVKLVCHSPLNVSTANLSNEGVISIPAATGKSIPGEKGCLKIAEGGNTENFNPLTGKLLLECGVDEPGEYEVRLYLSRHWRRSFAEGTRISLKVGIEKVFKNCLLRKDGELANVRQNSYPETWSRIGTVTFEKAGIKQLELSVNAIGTFRRLGFFGEDIQNESDNNIRVMRIELIRKNVQDRKQKHADLERLREVYPLALPVAKPTEVEAAFNMLKLFQLERLDNGQVSGLPLFNKEKLTLELVRRLAGTTRALAYAASQKLPEGKENFNLFLDYLIAERAFERIPKYRYSNYNDVRKVPADFLSALSVCDDTRKGQLIQRVKGVIEFEQLYLSPLELKSKINSDYVYNVLPHLFICALYHPDGGQAIADLDAFSRFLSACTQYTPGGNDLLKPDGTGFHHKTHYNGYMYSYRTLVEYVGRLKGSSFRIDAGAYQRLRKAIVSLYLMSTRSVSDASRLYANSLAGRHPFSGIGLSFTKGLFELLIEIGGDIKGEEADLELASYYNYFYQTEKYKNAPAINPVGFYQFNYSPLGVYRHDNWVASMRCPTTNFWGGELYAKTNRFGRYQSHGTLEILYDGTAESFGYPNGKDDKGGGWDWNVVPGSTTVHYASWEEMMPNKNETDRFDQKSLTTNFAGALSWGDCGVFAAAFDQGDNWGKRRFEPTNLRFCKSVFAIDGMLVSLGSNISAVGDYANNRLTATNLFQTVGKKGKTAFIVDGKEMKQGKTQVYDLSARGVWMVASNTTGYYVPTGNDSLIIQYGKQETPPSNGLQDGFKKAVAAKAYINHGVKPKNKKYCFVVVPNITPMKMEELSKQLEGKGKVFEILSTQDSIHALKHLSSGITAYSLFAPALNLSYGCLRSSDTEMLFMERMDKSKGTLSIAVCNPNLRPQPLKEFGWIATPTYTTFVLNGSWKLKDRRQSGDVLFIQNEASATTITVVLTEGEPLYLELIETGNNKE